jgi:phosphopentomutase
MGEHISLLVIGPDCKRGEVVTRKRELIDIPATIAEIFRFPMPTGQGSIMNELFK